MWQNMNRFQAILSILSSPADQQRSLEVGEREEAEDGGEQLRGKLVDHNLVHLSRLVFACQLALACQLAPWSATSYKQLQALQFVAGLTQKAAVDPWCS